MCVCVFVCLFLFLFFESLIMPGSMLVAKKIRVKKTVRAGRDMRGLLGRKWSASRSGYQLHGCVQFVEFPELWILVRALF